MAGEPVASSRHMCRKYGKAQSCSCSDRTSMTRISATPETIDYEQLRKEVMCIRVPGTLGLPLDLVAPNGSDAADMT
jgi:hypothetical protein